VGKEAYLLDLLLECAAGVLLLLLLPRFQKACTYQMAAYYRCNVGEVVQNEFRRGLHGTSGMNTRSPSLSE
jgi:hypothetical protein